jgi:hypothetical protein
VSKLFPVDKKAKVKRIIFQKADDFGYASRSRNDNGLFMDELVDDPDVGGVLKEFMSKEKIRTYIKDGVLNAYTKARTKKILAAESVTETILDLYSISTAVIQQDKYNGVSVCRSENGSIFVVSEGTVLKWETALRKALELVANEPNLTILKVRPSICLQLAVAGQDITDGEKKHISAALDAISVKAKFCCS